MYLSQVVLSPGAATARWLKNPYNIHQRVRQALPTDPRPLYRLEHGWGLESDWRLLVQSAKEPPDWEIAFGDLPIVQRYEFKQYEPQFAAGQVFAFRLRSCPTVTQQGVRRPLRTGSDQEAWLTRKLAAAGAELLSSEIAGRERQVARKAFKGHWQTITHHGVLFQGWLKVVRPAQLAAAVRQGVGTAKGLGFGLLSVMSPRV